MTALEQARGWVREAHPSAWHLESTLDWADRLDPGADEAVRLAALLHDFERAFPDPAPGWDPALHWDSREYLRWHQDRSATMAGDWLRDRGADPALVRSVRRLIAAHEDGGWREANLVQAADSLSFLETMVPEVAAWVAGGRAPRERAEAKLRHMAERIHPGWRVARGAAQGLLEEALRRLDRVAQR